MDAPSGATSLMLSCPTVKMLTPVSPRVPLRHNFEHKGELQAATDATDATDDLVDGAPQMALIGESTLRGVYASRPLDVDPIRSADHDLRDIHSDRAPAAAYPRMSSAISYAETRSIGQRRAGCPPPQEPLGASGAPSVRPRSALAPCVVQLRADVLQQRLVNRSLDLDERIPPRGERSDPPGSTRASFRSRRACANRPARVLSVAPPLPDPRQNWSDRLFLWALVGRRH